MYSTESQQIIQHSIMVGILTSKYFAEIVLLVGGVGKKLTFIYSGFIQFRDIREPQHFAKRENEPRWHATATGNAKKSLKHKRPHHTLHRRTVYDVSSSLIQSNCIA
jgi:hypothetical protein